MPYADTEYYEKEYLLGDEPVIPLTSFMRWSKQASNRINWKRVELDDVPDYLKQCTCAVAEALYTDAQNHKSGAKTSESVGAYSVTYADQRQESATLRAQIDRIILEWLAGTDLHNDFVYRGR